MPEALPLSLVPSFSKQQVHDLVNIIHSVMQQYFAPPNQSSSNSITLASTPPLLTPSAPQETQKEEDEQLLYQATVKDIVESITKHGSSMSDSQSILSTISRLCIARSSGDSAACLSKALSLACQ